MLRKTSLLSVFLALLFLACLPRPAKAQEASEELLEKIRVPLRMLQLSLYEADSRLYMPVEGVSVKNVADTWHAPRGGRRHEGEDVLAPKGSRVFSATPGVVLQMGYDRLGGNSVFVYAAGGRTYYYAHLDSFASGLKAGDEVLPSTLLGYVGDTGNARGGPAHLHFGMYQGKEALNPYALFTDRTLESLSPSVQ